MARIINIRWIVAAALLAAVTGAAHAADDAESLQKRFKERYARLVELKQGGKIGETAGGYVEAVNGQALEEATSVLVSDENEDRKKLYALIAAKEKVADTVVAERNAKRNFEKAKKGEFLKGKDGQWTQK